MARGTPLPNFALFSPWRREGREVRRRGGEGIGSGMATNSMVGSFGHQMRRRWGLFGGAAALVAAAVFLFLLFGAGLEMEMYRNLHSKLVRQETMGDLRGLPSNLDVAKTIDEFVHTLVDRNYYYVHVCSKGVGSRPWTHIQSLMGNTCEPWLMREAAEFMTEYLRYQMAVKSKMNILEWSSGSGTLFFLLHGGTVTSVENMGSWIMELQRSFNSYYPGLSEKWNPALVECPIPGSPEERAANPLECFKEYVEIIPDIIRRKSEYDFVSVDGRLRSECLRYAIANNLVKPGGVLMLDNSEREWYHAAMDDVPKHWLKVEYENRLHRTTFWIRPDGDKNEVKV